MEQNNDMPTQREKNNLRNMLASAYTSLDSYIKENDRSISEIQIMTARMTNMVLNEALNLGNDE